MAKKIPYWKFNSFLKIWNLRSGSKGCVICEDKSIVMSMDRPPPSLPGQAATVLIAEMKSKENDMVKIADKRPYLDFPAAYSKTVSAINTERSRNELRKILRRHVGQGDLVAFNECEKDIRRLHVAVGLA